MCDTVFKTLYREAYAFLAEQAGPEAVNGQLILQPKSAPRNMKDVYRRLINAIPGSNRMKEAVGPVESLAEPLLDFNPVKVHSRYGDRWEKLFDGITALRLSEPGKQDGLWESFCKAALSGAALLSQLRSVKTLKAFVEGFSYNEMAVAVLPLLLQKEVAGLSFNSACGFLDDCGYPDYVQPDQKVKAMLCDTGVTESRDNYEALKTLILIARASEVQPAMAHKVLWLIASGGLCKEGAKGSHRKAFIDHITPILEPMLQP